MIVLFQTLSGKDKAEAQKDRLLEYDQTSEQRTKVIDVVVLDAYRAIQ